MSTIKPWIGGALVVLLCVACGPEPGTPGARPRRAPPPRGPAPRPVTDSVKKALRKNLKDFRRKLRRCHELAMAEDFRVGGRVRLELVVRPMGVVFAVRTLENTSGNKLLAACLAHVAKGFVFPAADDTRTVRVAMKFTRPAEKYTVRLTDVPARSKLGANMQAQVLLSPRQVSGDQLSLVLLKLKPGTSLPLLKHASALGLHVLQGALHPRGHGKSMVLQKGQGGAIAAGTVHELAAEKGQVCAVLLFFGPAGAESLFVTGKPAAGTARPAALPRTRYQVLAARDLGLRAGGEIRISGQTQPVPRTMTVAKGQTATVNPQKAAMHHALLVTDGAFWVKLKGVKLPAAAGMAVYLPGGEPAVLSVAFGQSASFVVYPWPSRGGWTTATKHLVVRRSR